MGVLATRETFYLLGPLHLDHFLRKRKIENDRESRLCCDTEPWRSLSAEPESACARKHVKDLTLIGAPPEVPPSNLSAMSTA